MNEESCDEDCESYLLCELYNSTVLLKGIKGGRRLSQLTGFPYGIYLKFAMQMSGRCSMT